jgi:hypothetical protein
MAKRKPVRQSAAEKAARAKLRALAKGGQWIRGSVHLMARKCYVPTCRCMSGGPLHENLYLAAVVGGKRKLVYVPRELEREARALCQAWREIDKATAAVSKAALARFDAERRAALPQGGRRRARG